MPIWDHFYFNHIQDNSFPPRLQISRSPYQHHLITISTPPQLHLNTISLPSQHHLSTIPTPSQQPKCLQILNFAPVHGCYLAVPGWSTKLRLTVTVTFFDCVCNFICVNICNCICISIFNWEEWGEGRPIATGGSSLLGWCSKQFFYRRISLTY